MTIKSCYVVQKSPTDKVNIVTRPGFVKPVASHIVRDSHQLGIDSFSVKFN